MNPRTDLIHTGTMAQGLESRLKHTELMPAEDHLRPRRHSLWESIPIFVGTSALTVFFLGWFGPSFFVLTVFFMLILAGFWTARARQSRAVQKNLHAIQLLNEGHVEEAGEVFERLAQSEMRSWGHAVFVFNRGVAHMLAGRLQRAFSLFNAVYYSRAFRWGSHRGYEPLLLIEMGTCAALLGWMKEAEDYRKKALDCLPQSEFPRMLILDALILVRSGRHQEAISVISRDWDAAEHVIRPPSLRSVRVLMGFAMEATGMANSQDFRLLMEASKPERFNPHASFNEYDYLGVQWPQMLDFLRRRGFTTR